MSDPVKLALIALCASIFASVVPSIFAYLTLRKTNTVADAVTSVENKVTTVEANVATGDQKLDRIGASTDGRLSAVTEELRVLREFEATRVANGAEQMRLMQELLMRMAEKPDSAVPNRTSTEIPQAVIPLVEAVKIGVEDSLKDMTVETLRAEKLVVPTELKPKKEKP